LISRTKNAIYKKENEEETVILSVDGRGLMVSFIKAIPTQNNSTILNTTGSFEATRKKKHARYLSRRLLLHLLLKDLAQMLQIIS